MYCEKNKVDEAREVYKILQSSQLDFVLDDQKILRYGLALASSGAHEGEKCIFTTHCSFLNGASKFFRKCN